MSRARGTVAGLLVVAAVLFALGTSYEASQRSKNDTHTAQAVERSETSEHNEATEDALNRDGSGSGFNP